MVVNPANGVNGNVGTKFSYIAPEGFGWMNASFQVGVDFLAASRIADLRELRLPKTMNRRETAAGRQ